MHKLQNEKTLTEKGTKTEKMIENKHRKNRKTESQKKVTKEKGAERKRKKKKQPKRRHKKARTKRKLKKNYRKKRHRNEVRETTCWCRWSSTCRGGHCSWWRWSVRCDMTSSWSDHVWSGRGRFMCFAATLRHISTVARRTRVDVSFDDHAGSSFFFWKVFATKG